MKTTEKKATLALINRLSDINAASKELAAEAASIKAELKSIMLDMDTKVLAAGDYILVISDRVRTDVNKDRVQQLLGTNYEKCLKKIDYQTFEIKKS